MALVVALQRLSAQTAALLPTFTPAVAMMIAWMALGTVPGTTELVGALVVFLGFAMAAQKRFTLGFKPAQHLEIKS